MELSKILTLSFLSCAVVLTCGLSGCDSDTAGERVPPICEDADGDGYGSPASRACVHAGLDCDDQDADVYPGAPELCDGIDNQCQEGDPGYGIVDEDAACSCSFRGGSYLFTLADAYVKDDGDCPTIDATALFPPGTKAGPVALPGFQELPTSTVEIPFFPPIDPISVRFFSGVGIRLEGTEEVQVSIEGVGTVDATVTGAFCPGPEGGVLAGFVVSFAPPVACDVILQADGTVSAP